MQVLIVEDEEILRASLLDILRDHGIEACAFEEPVQALEFYSRSPVPIVISDVCLPLMSGMELLCRIKAIDPDTAVILMTALEELSNAVEAMKRGAFDYLTKPLDMNELIVLLKRAMYLRQIREENERLRKTLAGTSIIGESDIISLLRNAIQTAASSDLTVLLAGETGTGKDLAAQIIHEASARSGHRFVKISCSRYRSDVQESELLGIEPGTFADASRGKKGKLALAHRGTVYMDDVEDLTPDVQGDLVRVLDEKITEAVGSIEEIPADIRIIVSTKKNLTKLTQRGRFREGLYSRMNAYPIELPPLRAHKEDIPVMVRYFWDKMGYPKKTLTEDALRILEEYPWPGNVRELKNVVEMLALSCLSEVVTREDLPARLKHGFDEQPTIRPES
jgi:DNA-binding NtrC family response regulator